MSVMCARFVGFSVVVKVSVRNYEKSKVVQLADG